MKVGRGMGKSGSEFCDIYGKKINRIMDNLCPGCGEDNMPMPFDYITSKALNICPICKTDRTPTGGEE